MNIFLFAFYYLYKKNFLKYLLLVLFAGTFHRSTLLSYCCLSIKKFVHALFKKILELFLFFCIEILPYLLKTIVAPSGEYLYQSIFFR